MRYLILTLVLISSSLCLASEESNNRAIQGCLRNWKTHPFSATSPDYRTISAKVRVLGIGGDIIDDKDSGKPELILIKPNVSVLSKTTLRLYNPHGWYCLKGKVDVLGKTEIQLQCKAKLTSSKDGATVMAANDNDREDGVTVLGSSRIKRVGCAN